MRSLTWGAGLHPARRGLDDGPTTRFRSKFRQRARPANAHGDSDSIATLAGALLGARLGLEALPPDWVRDVERSAELLALGKQAATESAIPISL
jgi:hypothetical protein